MLIVRVHIVFQHGDILMLNYELNEIMFPLVFFESVMCILLDKWMIPLNCLTNFSIIGGLIYFFLSHYTTSFKDPIGG